MKSLFVILIPLFSVVCSFGQTDTYLPAKKGANWGFIDIEGNWLIPPIYEQCIPFEDRPYTSAIYKGNAVLINRKGETIINLKADEVVAIEDEYIIYKKGDLKGIMNKEGKVLCDAIFQDIEYSKTIDRFIVNQVGLYGLFHPNSELLVEPSWEKIETYDTFLYAQDSVFSYILSKNGDTLLPGYQSIRLINDYFLAIDTSGAYTLHYINGEKIIDGMYDYVYPVHKEFYALERGDDTYLYHPKSQTMVDSMRDRYVEFNDRFILTRSQDGYIGLWDIKQKKLVLEEEHNMISKLDNSSLLSARKGSLMALLDSNANLLSPYKYHEIGQPESDSLMKVRVGNKYGILQMDGKELLHTRFHFISINEDRTLKAKNEEGTSLYEYNSQLRIIDSLLFSNVSTLNLGGRIRMDFSSAASNGMQTISPFWFEDEKGRWGLKDSAGKVVIKPIYNDLVKVRNTPFVLGVINTKTILVKGSEHEIYKNKQYGLVNEMEFKPYGPPANVFIDTSTLRDENIEVARAIASNGFAFIIFKKDGRVRYFNSRYIGEFKDGAARIFLGNKMIISNYNYNGFQELMSLNLFALEMDLQIKTSRRARRSNSYKLLTSGFWAYIDHKGNYLTSLDRFKEMKISEASDFSRDRAIIKVGDRMALIDKDIDYILYPGYSSIRYLDYTNDSLIETVNISPRYGLVASSGKLIATPNYQHITDFSGGMAWAYKNDSVRLINSRGEIVYRDTSNKATDFSGGYAGIHNGRRYAIIDTGGLFITEHAFTRVGAGSFDLIPAKERSYYGYLDVNGNFHISPIYLKAEPFVDSIALVKEGLNPRLYPKQRVRLERSKYGYIGLDGNYIIKPQFDRAESFDQYGHAEVRKKAKKGIIDRSGDYILKPKYSKVFSGPDISVGYYRGRIKIVNDEGKVLKRISGTVREGFSDGLIVVKRGRNYGVLDSTGTWVLKPSYSSLFPFENGFSVVQSGRDCYIINISGDTVGTVYGRAMSGFQDGMCLIRTGERYFYVNHYGVNVFGLVFSDAEPFQDGLAVVRYDNSYGVIDANGFFKINPDYYTIERCSDDAFKVSYRMVAGVCDLNGNYIISPECDDINYLPLEEIFSYTSKNAVGYFRTDGSIIYRVE
ncbi:WG repeat-containing protein [bacterium]|nr:WG repeat-containing protein [bacterium]